jgi:hypothetical protein
MVLNAVGCYGFLAKAHIGHQVEGETAVGARLADVEARLSAALAAVAKLRGADDERRQAKRTSLADKLSVEAKALGDLKIEKAKVDGDRKVAEADLGPLRYVETLLGAGDQDVLRYFILVAALLLDPAAVLLLPAATRR